MGILFRLLAPRPVKRARRAMHPVRNARRAVTPRPVKKARRAVYAATNPLGALEGLAEDAVVAALRPRRSGKSRGRSTPVYAPASPPQNGRTAAAREYRAQVAHDSDRLALELCRLHLAPVPVARRLVAAEPPLVPEADVVRRLEKTALAGVSRWNRTQRRQARAAAASIAGQEIVAERARREQLRLDQQRRLDAEHERVLALDPDAVAAAIDAAGAAASFEMRTLGVHDATADVVVEFPGLEVIGETTLAWTSTGLPTSERRSKTSRNDLYIGAVTSAALAAAHAALAAAPTIKGVRVLVLGQAGAAKDVPVLAADIAAGAIKNTAEIEVNASPVALLNANELHLRRTGRTHELAELSDDEPLVAELLESYALMPKRSVEDEAHRFAELRAEYSLLEKEFVQRLDSLGPEDIREHVAPRIPATTDTAGSSPESRSAEADTARGDVAVSERRLPFPPR